MKTVLIKNVHDDLWRRLKAEAILSNKRVHEVLESVLKQWLEDNKNKPSPLTTILVKVNDEELWGQVRREAKDKHIKLGDMINLAVRYWMNGKEVG
jgi:hypothetical protein